MSWGARIEHTAGGLAITFAQPLSRLDMSADVAAHFASLIAIEARHHVAGVVRTLEAENGSTSVVPMRVQPKTRQTELNSFMPKNKPNRVTDGHEHPLCCDCDHCLNGDLHG